ncbi:MAG: hypothetical protein EOP22_07530 [Hyphomicrobiales bacterium]|nr:MAG: hypothetical protein EOP22_07530 [Hyphomicrobiales bacterium]
MSLSLITASYRRDLESCRLLCDSMDRFVTGYSTHYLVVPREDVALFAALAGPKRVIVDEDELLQAGLTQLPIKWKGRTYFWAPWLGRPIFGWHLQQLRKIAMTLAQPQARVMHVDSDNCFVRPFDVSRFASGPVPLFLDPGAVTDARLPDHATWLRNAHALLGLQAPVLPGDDYVGQMIVWDRAAVTAMTERIEAVTGQPWLRAIARTGTFSEYMLYGAMVANDRALMARHEIVHESPCLTYWDGAALDGAALRALAKKLGPGQSAIAVQSFIGTPVELIRQLALHEAA